MSARAASNLNMAIPIWLREKLFRKSFAELKNCEGGFADKRKLFAEHHLSHAASHFPSPFDEAVVLTLDGVGNGRRQRSPSDAGASLIAKEIYFPHSIGLLCSTFTYYPDFGRGDKVMGLAPYGEARFKGIILNKLVD